jgi:hypothetical protein
MQASMKLGEAMYAASQAANEGGELYVATWGVG